MWQYLTKIIETKSSPGKIYGNSGMVHFAGINQDPPSDSMLQHIGRVATRKLASRNCLRYLQTTLIMGGGELVSEFMWGIVSNRGVPKSVNFPFIVRVVSQKTATEIVELGIWSKEISGINWPVIFSEKLWKFAIIRPKMQCHRF